MPPGIAKKMESVKIGSHNEVMIFGPEPLGPLKHRKPPPTAGSQTLQSSFGVTRKFTHSVGNDSFQMQVTMDEMIPFLRALQCAYSFVRIDAVDAQFIIAPAATLEGGYVSSSGYGLRVVPERANNFWNQGQVGFGTGYVLQTQNQTSYVRIENPSFYSQTRVSYPEVVYPIGDAKVFYVNASPVRLADVYYLTARPERHINVVMNLDIHVTAWKVGNTFINPAFVLPKPTTTPMRFEEGSAESDDGHKDVVLSKNEVKKQLCDLLVQFQQRLTLQH